MGIILIMETMYYQQHSPVTWNYKLYWDCSDVIHENMLFISSHVINMYDHGKSYICEIYRTYPILFVCLLMLFGIIIKTIESCLHLILNEVTISFIM